MLCSYVVKRLIRQSFENVNNHNYDELLKAVAPNVHHRFAGAHSIGGERQDKVHSLDVFEDFPRGGARARHSGRSRPE
jgi:ketosteroid isomerase-like protein